ncbi:MAG TPA: MATE family efflux transporter [Eubacterium sp.]|nr:MATE family efflux transporter [Eubacterium sp.]
MRKHPDRHTYLTETPIPKLIPALAVPTIISMLVTGIYNSADTYFVGRISTQATAAVGLVFSVMAIIQAFGFFCGQGSGNYLSRLLGAGKKQEANEVAITGFLMALVIGLLIAALGNWQAERLADWIGATDTSRADTIAYMRIILMGAPFMTCQFVINNQLRFQGSAMYAMIGLMCGAVVNIILDPVLIFGLGPVPAMGVAGAAVATVVGQWTAALLALLFNLKKNPDVTLGRRYLRLRKDVVGQILSVGIPTTVMMAIGSVMNFGMNQIFQKLDPEETATSVFGVYYKLQSFFFMPVFGLNNGLIPVLAYNYGARNKERIREALEFAMMLAVGVMLVGLVIFETIPDVLLKMFNASDKMMDMGKVALRTMCLSFPFAGLCIAMGSVFQAFSKSIYSLIISVGRQLVILIPAAYLLSLLGNVNYVWWSFPIAEIASVILSVFFYRKVHREIVDKL